MLKMFVIFMALSLMFSPNFKELEDDVMFKAYNNGNEIVITQESQEQIDKFLCAALKGSRRMPALGVSLHDETMQDVNSGIWIRFSFSKTHEVDGMPFDDLLIKLRKDLYGTNVIRGNNGNYDGRCFYIDLRNNMDELYGYLQSLPVSENKFEINQHDIVEGPENEIITRALNDEFEDIYENRGKRSIPLSQELKIISKDKKQI